MVSHGSHDPPPHPRRPLWAFAFFGWQLAVNAFQMFTSHEAFGGHLEELSSPAWAWATGLPVIVATGFGWFHPLSFYSHKERESGLFDPTRRVRVWVVGLYALWLVPCRC